MTALAAIRGTFSDFKIIRGRKCAQLVIEVPLEEADAALQALGGIPNPVNEAWVAVARLDLSKAQGSRRFDEAPKGGELKEKRGLQRRFSELPPATQAALKCKEGAFQKFIGVMTESEAADHVRDYCCITTRAALNIDPKAAETWKRLLSEFDVWMMDVEPA